MSKPTLTIGSSTNENRQPERTSSGPKPVLTISGTPAQSETQPAVTQQQNEPFQLRMAKQQAAENEVRRRVQEMVGGIAESSVKDTQQKRANQAAADKEYRNSVWDFLNTMISNAGAGGAGVVASPMDAAEAHGNLQEAKQASDEAAAAFDKQNILERQGHELSGWGQRTVGNLGNTLLTLGDAYNQADARMQAYDPNNLLISQMLGQDPLKEAERQVEARTGEEARAALDKAYSSMDRIAERGNEELQRAKDGASALGRLGLDLETGALDLGADALTNAVAPGAGMVSMGARVFGEAAREERQKGGDLGQQMLAGTKAAAIEVFTEKIGGPFEKIYGKSFAGKAINKAIDAIDSKGGRAAIKLLSDALGEGAEEVLSDILNPVADRTLGLADSWGEAWSDTTVESVLYDGLLGTLLGAAGSAGQIISTKGRITPADIQQIKADAQAAGESAVLEAAQQAAPAVTENTTQSAEIERDASEDIPAPPATENADTGESERLNRASAAEETATVETPQAAAAQTAPEQTAMQPTAAAETRIASVEQSDSGKTVERGFSENVRTDANMEQAIRDDFTADPDYYTQLANRDTLGKAQAIYDRGIDEARATLDRAIEAAKAGRKLAPEMVPLARMVANELSRTGDKNAARRILSDIAVELTQAGQLGQAAKILRGTDPETALRAVQKALDKINAERQKRFGNKNKWTAELTEEERAMLEGIDIGDDAAYQEAYRQIAERLGREMPATLWEKLTELRRINMLLKPRTQIRNLTSNVPMVALRKGAETLSGAIQDALVKTGAMDKAEQTRTLKVGKEYRDAAKNYFTENKDSILSEGNKWDINSMLREQRTYFKDGALTKAMSKLTGKEQQNLLEQARRFTYDLLEKGDAPFVKSAFVDSLSQYMAAQGITDFNNIPSEAVDFAMANAMEATFKNANVMANFLNQVKRSGTVWSVGLDVLFPFTTTPLNITSLMLKYSPAGFGSAIYDAIKGRATTAQIVDKASKATVGSVVFGLGLLLRSMGAITGRADDDKDKAALDKTTGKSPYSIGGRWSYDWAQPVGSLLALGAETWDAAQGQEGVAEALMQAMYSAGDSILEMSLFQNVKQILGGYGSGTEKVLDAIIEGGASQFVPGLAGDIAKLIDGTVRSTYTGGNTWQDALARMGVNIPGLSKTMPANVNVKGEENTRGGFLLRSFETLVDPGTINKNQMDAADREIYDLYERTGDKTIFPSVSPYSFDHGGETYRMTGEERETFQTTQGQLYYDMLESLMDSGDWDNMSDKAKVKLLQDARAYALDEAKRELVEARGGEYESGNWEGVSGLADGDADTAAQYLSVRDAATTAIKGKDYDVLDQLLGDGGAYHDLGEDAQDMLFSSIDGLKRLVSMRGDGVSAENAMKAFDAIKGLKTQDEQTAAIVGLDGMSDADKIKVLKACTSEEYAEKVKTAYDSGVSLGEWSRVYAARQRINKGEGTAQNKATDFAAWLDKNTNLTAAQKDVVQDQLSFYSMNKAEPTHYDGLRESKVNEDTARRIANAMTMIQPLEGKTQATQEQKVDTILGMGLSDGDTWAALKEYTSPAYYNKAAEAYRKDIDLDDYVRQFREADLPNDKGETNGQLTQDELWKYYKANPDNETFVKVMWMIGGFKTDWETYKRKHK